MRKRTLFTESDVNEVFAVITAAVDHQMFEYMMQQFRTSCPQLTERAVATAVVANLVYDYARGGGLDEMHERLGCALKKHYEHEDPDGHGVLNCTVAEHKARLAHFLEIPINAI